MKTITAGFPGNTTALYLGESLSRLKEYADPGQTVIITDDRVMQYHGHLLENWKKIRIPAGEEHKSLESLQWILDELIRLAADRNTLVVGAGGGVITDLSGFAASIYLRGVPFAFVPTTLLGQVDASVGGKNGINYGAFKNILGTISQPRFILFDFELLRTLPPAEWSNGYAEIIKYACILDQDLFDRLETTPFSPEDMSGIAELVERAVVHKMNIVREDERESGKRRWLNFGHTVGHAVERLNHIPHGQAVSIGMVAAARISEQLSGFPETSTRRLIRLLESYGLPVSQDYDKTRIMDYVKMDKKKEKDRVHFVLLSRIGTALTMPVDLDRLKLLLMAL